MSNPNIVELYDRLTNDQKGSFEIDDDCLVLNENNLSTTIYGIYSGMSAGSEDPQFSEISMDINTAKLPSLEVIQGYITTLLSRRDTLIERGYDRPVLSIDQGFFTYHFKVPRIETPEKLEKVISDCQF